MSRRHRSDKPRRFSPSANDDGATDGIMDTSIGSDGERSDNDYDAEDVTPSTTPVSESHVQQRAKKFLFNLKFSIDNILKPEFGRQNGNDGAGGGSDSSGSPPTFPTTPSPLSSPTAAGQRLVVGGTGRSSIAENLLSAVNAANASNASSQAPTPAPQSGTPALWPAWVYCTRYSDRPSSGPRCRRVKRTAPKKVKQDEKRPRTAFTVEQLSRLKSEFQENRYLTEKRRQDLARELGLNESQIKIWFQNKRAKIKKQTGGRNMLALHLMAQGLYDHATIPVVGGGEDDSGGDHDEDEDVDMDMDDMEDGEVSNTA